MRQLDLSKGPGKVTFVDFGRPGDASNGKQPIRHVEGTTDPTRHGEADHWARVGDQAQPTNRPHYRLQLSFLQDRLHAAIQAQVPPSAVFAPLSTARNQPKAPSAVLARAAVLATRCGLDDASWQRASVEEFAWTTDSLETALAALDRLDRNPESDLAVEWQTPKPKLKPELRPGDLNLRAKRSMNWFDLHDGNPKPIVPLVDIVRAVRSGKKYVVVDGDTYYPIADELRRLLDPVARAAALKNGKVAVDLGALLNGGSAFRDVCTDLADAYAAIVEAWERAEATARKTPLKIELFPFQAEGLLWLLRTAVWSKGACLGDDMGVGKTRQVLALLFARRHIGPQLVIAPAGLVRDKWGRGDKLGTVIHAISGSGEPPLTLIDLASSNWRLGNSKVATYSVAVASYEFAASCWSCRRQGSSSTPLRSCASCAKSAPGRACTTRPSPPPEAKPTACWTCWPRTSPPGTTPLCSANGRASWTTSQGYSPSAASSSTAWTGP